MVCAPPGWATHHGCLVREEDRVAGAPNHQAHMGVDSDLTDGNDRPTLRRQAAGLCTKPANGSRRLSAPTRRRSSRFWLAPQAPPNDWWDTPTWHLKINIVKTARPLVPACCGAPGIARSPMSAHETGASASPCSLTQLAPHPGLPASGVPTPGWPTPPSLTPRLLNARQIARPQAAQPPTPAQPTSRPPIARWPSVPPPPTPGQLTGKRAPQWDQAVLTGTALAAELTRPPPPRFRCAVLAPRAAAPPPTPLTSLRPRQARPPGVSCGRGALRVSRRGPALAQAGERTLTQRSRYEQGVISHVLWTTLGVLGPASGNYAHRLWISVWMAEPPEPESPALVPKVRGHEGRARRQSRASSMSIRFSTLPVGLRGNCSRNTTPRGTL